MAERGLALDEPAAADLNRVWHRLQPWPDSVAGLARLKRRFTIPTLSNGDLRAAATCGLRTAYVPRPLERGPGGAMEAWAEGEFDLVAADFNALAGQLNA